MELQIADRTNEQHTKAIHLTGLEETKICVFSENPTRIVAWIILKPKEDGVILVEMTQALGNKILLSGYIT